MLYTRLLNPRCTAFSSAREPMVFGPAGIFPGTNYRYKHRNRLPGRELDEEMDEDAPVAGA